MGLFSFKSELSIGIAPSSVEAVHASARHFIAFYISGPSTKDMEGKESTS